MPTGSATINFGSGVGEDFASVTVTGQSSIQTSSKCEAFFMSVGDSNATADEYMLVDAFVSLTAGNNIVAGTGFDIDAVCPDGNMSGSWTVYWVWV